MAYVVLTLVFLAVAAGVCYRTIANGLKACSPLTPIRTAPLPWRHRRGRAGCGGGVLPHRADSRGAAPVRRGGFGHPLCQLHWQADHDPPHSQQLPVCHLSGAEIQRAPVRRPQHRFENGQGLRGRDPCHRLPVPGRLLKAVLELSYHPDPRSPCPSCWRPSLIASLVLCIACLLITRSVPTAVSAFAAACCACVAVSNMVAVNLPISACARPPRPGRGHGGGL